MKNEYDGYNSVIEVQVPVTFLLNGYNDASEIILAGDFNDWSEHEYKMSKTERGWAFTAVLSRGKYHYKFIVDGEWITDPGNPVREHDGKGNINSVRMVKD